MIGRGTDAEPVVRRLRDLRDGARSLPDVIALGGAAVPALELLVREPSGSISDHRRLGVRALRAIGTEAARAALDRALADSITRRLDPVEQEAEDLVIADVACALGALGSHQSANALLRALSVRQNAGCAEALGALGDTRAVPLLVRCLADATARGAAREALKRFPNESVPALAAALFVRPLGPRGYEGANSVLTRTVVAEVLGELPCKESRNALERAIRDPQPAVRIAAALALAHRGDAGDGAIPALAEALGGDRWDVAEEARGALRAMGGEPALRAVAEVARRGETALIRNRAIATLAQWPGIDAARSLASLRDDRDPLVREALAEALADRREPSAREALDALSRDPEPMVKRRAAVALGQGTGGLLRAAREFLARHGRRRESWRHALPRGHGESR